LRVTGRWIGDCGLRIGDWGLWIEDWGLGIGLMQITPNLPSFFHFIQKLLIFFF